MPPYVVVETTKVASSDLIRKVHGPLSSIFIRTVVIYQIERSLTRKISSRERLVTTMGTRVRSAVTGQYVPKSEAIKHPKTTVTETTKPPKK